MIITLVKMLNTVVLLCLLHQRFGFAEITDHENLRLLNDRRREFAKKFDIPNMHELEFEPNLLDEVRRTDVLSLWLKKEKKRFKTWRFTLLLGYWDTDIMTRVFGRATEKSRKEMLMGVLKSEDVLESDKTKEKDEMLMQFYDMMVPEQKFIGCQSKDEGKMLCLYGPEGYAASFFEAKGAPGSKCAPGYNNDDGLCSHSAPAAAQNLQDSSSTAFNVGVIYCIISFVFIFFHLNF